jgi:hypothetical protein
VFHCIIRIFIIVRCEVGEGEGEWSSFANGRVEFGVKCERVSWLGWFWKRGRLNIGDGRFLLRNDSWVGDIGRKLRYSMCYLLFFDIWVELLTF